MNLTNLFKRKKELTLEVVCRRDLGENIVEIIRYRDGKEIQPSVLAYTFSEKFVEAVNSYQ